MKISELSVDYVSFDDDDKEISAIAISYKDERGHEFRRWLAEVRTGYWIMKRKGAWVSQICSRCNNKAYEANSERNLMGYKFCPYCGAAMGQEENQS